HRLLRLLREAIRADVHFIACHPTTLFQWLWNRGWWYDCPHAALHYETPEGGWNRDNAPWLADGPKLHELLEAWCRWREVTYRGFGWVRAVRAPSGGRAGPQGGRWAGREAGRSGRC